MNTVSRLAVIFILFLFNLNLFGQTTLKGIVMGNGNALANAEVVNVSKKNIKKTDAKGRFSIMASIGDEILIVAKDYNEKRIKLNKEHFKSDAVFELEQKPIELKEIEIAKTERIKVDASYEALKMEQLKKEESAPKVVGVYTGVIEKGIDFIEIGNKIFKFKEKRIVVKDDKDVPKKVGNFKQYVRREFSNEFFTTQLNLKENEIDSFIAFCENDLKSRDVTQQNGPLDVLEFMLEKRKDFKN